MIIWAPWLIIRRIIRIRRWLRARKVRQEAKTESK
jgi:hypothetical protein